MFGEQAPAQMRNHTECIVEQQLANSNQVSGLSSQVSKVMS
jgi:hypothetical protein